MASGIELLMTAVLKSLPVEVKTAIANLGQISVDLKSQLDRIEATQQQILKEFEHARSEQPDVFADVAKRCAKPGICAGD